MAVTDDVTRYRDITRLGVGGMATVTLAEDTMLRRQVALKRVHAGGDARAIARLRREALVGASLSHPNLVSIYDVQTGEHGDLVIVMEYVAGETLRDAIERSGGLPQALALEVLGGVAAALDAIHARGIVHRDVKPANILLGREGAIKLADLGIAVAADRTQITAAGVVLGTFSYMAPEQLGGEVATPAVDIYALAVVAFEMLSGEKARPQSNPVALAHAMATQPPPDLRDVAAQTPPAAAAVLRRGMAADPADRPRTAGELVERLRAALGPERRTEPDPPRAVPAAAPRIPGPAPRRPTGPDHPPAARGLSPRIPEPAPVPVAVAPRAEAVAPGPAPEARRVPDLAGAMGGKRWLILAGLAAFGLAVVALGLLNSGGGSPAGRTASTGHRTSGSAAPGSGAKAAGSGAGASTGAGTTGAASTGTGVVANPDPSTPAGAVQAFYLRAARHDYAGAWTLADPAFQTQLSGYRAFAAQQSAVRRITFHRAQTRSTGQNTATVDVQTTSELDSRTQQCSGPVRVVRSPSGGWVLDQISINCS